MPLLIELPTTELDLINNVVARELIEPNPATTDAPTDPTLDILDRLVNGVLNGTDLSGVRDDVTRILANQDDKARIVTTLIQNHDYHRINQLLQMRAIQENILWRACRRGDLNTAESLAFFRLASSEIGKIVDSLRDGDNGSLDSASVVDKVDPTNRETDRQLQAAYHATTPHGREIIRKRLYDLKRAQVLQKENEPVGGPS